MLQCWQKISDGSTARDNLIKKTSTNFSSPYNQMKNNSEWMNKWMRVKRQFTAIYIANHCVALSCGNYCTYQKRRDIFYHFGVWIRSLAKVSFSEILCQNQTSSMIFSKKDRSVIPFSVLPLLIIIPILPVPIVVRLKRFLSHQITLCLWILRMSFKGRHRRIFRAIFLNKFIIY